jgi:hypothetical protein
MADTQASIRLDLKTEGFKSGLKRTEADVASSSKRMGSSFQQGMEAGVKGGLSAVRGLFSAIKSGVGIVTGLLGGVGFGALVKGAIDSQTQFRNLSFAIQTGSGQLVKWQTLQQNAQATAIKWGQQSEALGRSLETIFADTTNLDFAQKAMDTIAITARGTGSDIDQLSKIAGVLNQKFGITAKDLPEAMTAVVTAAQGLGPQALEKLGDDFGEIGGKARSMGQQGVGAVKSMLGWLTIAKRESGRFEQAMTALPQIFDQLLERTSGGKVTSGGRIPITVAAVDAQGNPRDPGAIIADIIAKTGGDATKLGEFGFGGEGLQTVLALAKDFRAEFEATGGDLSSATAFVREQLMDAGGSALDYADVQKRAEENMGGTAGGIDKALEILKTAFTKPEMMSAIQQLAEQLPKLAEGIASMLDIILENPLLAAGGVMAGTALKGGLQATLSQAFSSGGQTAAGSIQNALTSGGKNAGASIAGGFAGTVALTAAISAWTAALDQANKLRKDIKTHEQDIVDERRNMLEVAERQGQKYAVRERGAAETLLGGEAQEAVYRTKEGKIAAMPLSEFKRKTTGRVIGFPSGGGGAAPTPEEVAASGTGGAGAYIPPELELGPAPVRFDPTAAPDIFSPEGMALEAAFPTSRYLAPPAVDANGTGGQKGADQITEAVRAGNREMTEAVRNLPNQLQNLPVTIPSGALVSGAPTPGSPTPGNVDKN